MTLRTTVAAVASALLLAPGALAASSADPAAVQFAKLLKADMQKTLGAKIPGLKMTTVTCTLAKNHKTGTCQAHFTRTKDRVVGVYKIALTVNTATGNVRTRTVSVTCTDSKTGAKVKC